MFLCFSRQSRVKHIISIHPFCSSPLILDPPRRDSHLPPPSSPTPSLSNSLHLTSPLYPPLRLLLRQSILPHQSLHSPIRATRDPRNSKSLSAEPPLLDAWPRQGKTMEPDPTVWTYMMNEGEHGPSINTFLSWPDVLSAVLL